MTVDFDNSNRLLLELADLLEALPPERFDYRHWVGLNWEGDPTLACGTTACALGWATTMPELKKAGLFLRRREQPGANVGFRDESAWLTETECGALAFGITNPEAEFLFCPETYLRPEGDHGYTVYEMGLSPSFDATAEEVALHIRSFVVWRRAQVTANA